MRESREIKAENEKERESKINKYDGNTRANYNFVQSKRGKAKGEKEKEKQRERKNARQRERKVGIEREFKVKRETRRDAPKDISRRRQLERLDVGDSLREIKLALIRCNYVD